MRGMLIDWAVHMLHEALGLVLDAMTGVDGDV